MMTVAQTLNELIIFAKTFDGIASLLMIGAVITMLTFMIRDTKRTQKANKEREKEREEFKSKSKSDTWAFNPYTKVWNNQ